MAAVLTCYGVRRSTVDEGGETVFPNAETKVSGPEWSTCAQKGLAVKTRKGDALLFFRCGTACIAHVKCAMQW